MCRNSHPDCSLDLTGDEDLSDFPSASIRMLEIYDGKLISHAPGAPWNAAPIRGVEPLLGLVPGLDNAIHEH